MRPSFPSPDIQAFFDSATNTVTYLVSDPSTKTAAVIDPVLDFDPRSARIATRSADAVLTAASAANLSITMVLETHVHADHLSAADHIRKTTGARVIIGEHIVEVQKTFAGLFEADDVALDGSAFSRLARSGDNIALGNLTIGVIHTPGHTPACVSYRIGDAVFVGDTLFMPDYGTARADFPGGDARTLYASIRKLLALPVETRLFVGHDYLPAGRESFQWQTTVGEERAHNVHVRDGVDEEAFVAAREARDRTLAPPVLILPSLQVNIRAGAMPPASAGGHVFLKLPVNAL